MKQAITRPVLTWLRREARKGVAVGALCTGAQALAQAGLLGGQRCTIHWENRDSFAEDFPDIELTQNMFRHRPGPVYGGGRARPTDLMLKLIAGGTGRAGERWWPTR